MVCGNGGSLRSARSAPSWLCIVPPLSHYRYMLKVESGNEYANNIKIYIYFYDFISIVCGGMARHGSTKNHKGLKSPRHRQRCFFFRSA